ncbi:MAG: protein-methionine-sulfoxide reductase heme-binding subunit MsrQ [Pseudomonadota bacterium]|nr:protein-methionine-sulfoxide reductase heme-binding subunit MsrQ [Pseudomonadota bacterium]
MKSIVFVACAIPLILVGWDVAVEIRVPGSVFGADPAEAIVDLLGNWTIRLLIVTLSISTIARVFKRPKMITLRRTIGLWSFAYGCMHFSAYFTLLAEFSVSAWLEDFSERTYITAGMTAFILLIPLAVTSTRNWQRRLGTRWRKLHALIYPASIAALLHVLWVAKASFLDVFIYGLALAILLAERIVVRIRRREGRAAIGG